ncbi:MULTISPECIES: helix-turn-helix transcriptional regulator [unclassified Luteococcus]|uniref:helix-turn-helix transcriptional regulator n=1 Tax=unclassified Luteococcus TaxID=2639923 RepID=UPI00313E741A
MPSDSRAQIGEFLRSCRLRAQPTEAEVRLGPSPRRVAGLRREEVAARAAISLDYYIQLERGHVGEVSDSILGSLMAALGLDDVERQYLADLLRGVRLRPSDAPPAVSPGLMDTIDRLSTVAATVRDHRMKLLAANALGAALFRRVAEVPDDNIARHVFLDPRTAELYPDLPVLADEAAGTLRTSLANHQDDAELLSLIEDLKASPDFVARWESHRVLRTGPGVQRFRDPDVGDLTLQRDQFAVLDGSGLVMNLYRPHDASQEPAFASLAEVDLGTGQRLLR